MPYIVKVDDNYHHGDESERYTHGRFADAEGALAACRMIVDRCLAEELKPGISAAELYSQYTSFGDDPFVVCVDAAQVRFSAWDYAKLRCDELCSPATDQIPPP